MLLQQDLQRKKGDHHRGAEATPIVAVNIPSPAPYRGVRENTGSSISSSRRTLLPFYLRTKEDRESAMTNPEFHVEGGSNRPGTISRMVHFVSHQRLGRVYGGFQRDGMELHGLQNNALASPPPLLRSDERMH